MSSIEEQRQRLRLMQMQQKQRDGAAEDPNSAAALGLVPPHLDTPMDGVRTPRPDRFGDTIRDATEEPIAMTKAFAGGLVDQGNSPTMAAMPDWMPESARSPLAYAGDAAMTGLGAAGSAYAFGAGLVGETLGGSPTNERKLARDLMLAGQVAIPELAGVSGTLRAGASASRAAKNVSNATPLQSGARAADELGVTPSLGMTGKTGGMLAAGLEKVPFSGSVIARDAERAVGEIEMAFARATGKIGDASSPAIAGEKLQGGLNNYVVRFKSKADEKFGAVANHLPGDTRIDLSNTTAAIDGVKSVFEGNPALAQKLGVTNWDAVLSEAAENGISWNAVRQFRSDVGEAIGTGRGTLGDDGTARLKTLYAGLTQDMEAAAKAAGKPAERAWREANDYYRNGAQRIESALDKTINASSPERAFEAFSSMTRSNASTADITRMRKIKASMKPGEWRDLSASIVDRMGKSKPGQQNAAGDAFSPSVFLTEYNKMSSEAKRILLPEDVRVEFEKLASVAERAKAANAERNFSNTGTPIGVAAIMYGSVVDMGMTGAAVGGANLSARAFTSTPFLRAMNKWARGDTRQLKAMANGNGPFAKDAATVLRISAAEAAAGGNAANSAAGSPAAVVAQ